MLTNKYNSFKTFIIHYFPVSKTRVNYVFGLVVQYTFKEKINVISFHYQVIKKVFVWR